MMKCNKLKYIIVGGIFILIGVWIAEYFSNKIIVGVLNIFIDDLNDSYTKLFRKVIIPYRFLVHIVLGAQFGTLGIVLASIFTKTKKTDLTKHRKRKSYKIIKKEKIKRNRHGCL